MSLKLGNTRAKKNLLLLYIYNTNILLIIFNKSTI